MRDGFEEGDYVLIDPRMVRQYMASSIEPPDELLDAVITEKKDTEHPSESFKYMVRLFHERYGTTEYLVLDDCFIKACQHCRNQMLYHDTLEKWFCPFCEEIPYLSVKRRTELNG